MAKRKGPLCYAPLVQKIQEMDTAIKDMKVKIEKLKTVFYEMEDDESEEECMDVAESELAVMKIMREVYVSAVTEEEPEGDA